MAVAKSDPEQQASSVWNRDPEHLLGVMTQLAREATMLSIYECASVIPGCRFVAQSERRNDVVAAAIEHMHQVHDIEHLSDSLKARIRAVIKESPVEAAISKTR